MAKSLRESTQRSYTRATDLFRRFHLETNQPSTPFPLDHKVLLEFVAWCSGRKVASDTIAQYVSAVRHEDKLRAQPTREHVEMAIRGVANLRIAEQGPKEPGAAWESQWVCQAAELASRLILSRSQIPLRDIQALLCSIVGFLFALRSASIASIDASHLTYNGGVLVLQEHVRKAHGPQAIRTLKIPVPATAQPFHAVFDFLFYMGQRHPNVSESFLVSEYPASEPSKSVDHALDRTLSLLSVPTPMTTQQKSHALRRGAAVAMLSIGVPTLKSLSWGGWANDSSMKTYVSGRTFVACSQSDQNCFGWMLQSQLPDSVSSGSIGKPLAGSSE